MNFVQQLKAELAEIKSLVEYSVNICEQNEEQCGKALDSGKLSESERAGMLGRKNAFAEMKTLLNTKI